MNSGTDWKQGKKRLIKAKHTYGVGWVLRWNGPSSKTNTTGKEVVRLYDWGKQAPSDTPVGRVPCRCAERCILPLESTTHNQVIGLDVIKPKKWEKGRKCVDANIGINAMTWCSTEEAFFKGHSTGGGLNWMWFRSSCNPWGETNFGDWTLKNFPVTVKFKAGYGFCESESIYYLRCPCCGYILKLICVLSDRCDR